MKYQVRPSRFDREWIVEAFNEDGDGDIHMAAFSGPEAKTRAFEYAAWENNQDREPITA